MLEHGGRLRQAAARYGIPLENWLDLSAALNPQPWPVPPVPPSIWHRLPEDQDGLEQAAITYYSNARLLPVAGSQAAIQALPSLFAPCSVACVSPLYAEHPHAWEMAGHRVQQCADLNAASVTGASVIVVCHPNNPTAKMSAVEELLSVTKTLQKRGGYMLVDEAFIDTQPAQSVTQFAGSADYPNLIVLRSMGKFFGLAGIRVGFVFATDDIRWRIHEKMGPWAVSGPSRWVAQQALADHVWQDNARTALPQQAKRLAGLLAPISAAIGQIALTDLFVSVEMPDALPYYEHFATQGILTRVFPEQNRLRLGLPAEENDWERLVQAIQLALKTR